MRSRSLVVVLGVLLALLAPSCKQRDDEAVKAVASPTVPFASGPVPADRLLQALAAHGEGRLQLETATLSYVREDGSMDPTYGRFEATLIGAAAPEPDDDPQRPLGAPAPAPRTFVHRECVKLEWAPGRGLHPAFPALCMGVFGGAPLRFRCSVLAVWARAIADGAPRGALARTSISASFAASGDAMWSFEIDDAPRGVSFRRSYPDDCAPIVESPVER
ncbi:MAG: hypothetical protein M3680_32285 [Myxococcota bacterium]|nr:hypothetical protein [Myxococcota bacterium]